MSKLLPLIERLRNQSKLPNTRSVVALCGEAADEIERLRVERDQWHRDYARLAEQWALMDAADGREAGGKK